MTVKDRLAELNTVQAEHATDDWEAFHDEVQLNIELVDDGPLKEFLVEIEDVRDRVGKLEANTALVRKVHSDILSSPFNDDAMQDQLKDLMAEIKRTAYQVRTKLKEFELGIEQAQEHSDSPAEVRIRKMQYQATIKLFIQVMTDYNKAQEDYREMCKARIKRHAEIAGKQMDDDQIEDMLEDGNANVFMNAQGIVMDTMEMKLTLKDIEARHADIISLEKSIQELHDMFVDMAVLVESQGELIDRIEVQVEEAVEFVDRANADMKKAREFQAKARKKKLMMIITGTIVGLILCMIIKQKLGL